MRRQLFTLGAVLFSSINFSTAQITFQKTFGGANWEAGTSIQQTTDGGYIIIGLTNSFGAGNYDVYLIKTNVNGDSLWTKTFGGGGDEIGYSVKQTTDSGYIIAGYTDSFGSGSYDVYLIKTDVNGDSLWTKTFGGGGDEIGYSVQQTTDGGYIIAGYTGSFGATDYNSYLIKTNANGNTLWTKTFASLGGNWDQRSNSVQQTTDGGYIITGYATGYGSGTYDVSLIKTNANGDSLWIKYFGGINWDRGHSVQQTTDGGYIVVGFTSNFGAGGPDVYLIKTNANGDLLWSKTFGGTNTDEGNSVQQTTDGGYIITAGLGGYVYLIKTDFNGDSLWTKAYGGGNGWGNSVQQTTDGGYVIVGWTLDFGVGNVYLIKTDSLGNSGCNTGNLAISIATPATAITNITTIVSSPPTIVTTPAAIVDCGGIVTTLCTNVGINEIINNNLFLISPNPSSGNFNISYLLPQNKEGRLEIFDIDGRKVYSLRLPQWSTLQMISLPELSNGLYHCVITSDNMRVSKKVAVINE